MQGALSKLLRGLLLTGAYFTGAVVAVLFLRTPADVTLLWPAAGIGYALVLRYGLKYASAIALAQLLLHLFVVPVPTQFLAYSVASNTLGVLVACSYVARRSPNLHIDMADGLLLFRGGLLLAVTSAALGMLGMLHAGMIPQGDAPRAFLQWALGDLLGVTSVTPTLLLLTSSRRYGAPRLLPATGGQRERAAWFLLMVAALAGGLAIATGGGMYPLSAASLPIALLLWSGARFPPMFTTTATMAVTLLLALVMGLGLLGFGRPETMRDTGLLMGTLVIYSFIPMLLLASHQERFNAMTALHVRATRDALTNLLNRAAFEEQARTTLAQATTPITLLYLDLDHFKLVNDATSHVAGDEMIRHVSTLVQQEFDGNRLVARTGGDEFAVLAALDEREAVVRGRRLIAAIEAMRVAWQGQNLSTTASIGIASSTPPHLPFDELLSLADTACFEAKELGGNSLYASATNTESLHRRTSEMRSALAAREVLNQGRFELWGQPIIDLRGGGIAQHHFEVLLRWRDVEGNLRPPAELIAAAERYRLGPRLDRHVLDAVLDWLETRPDACSKIDQCGINLGATTLVDDDFGDYLASRLSRSRLRPEQLCFEITETSVVRDMTRTRRFIARMRDMGCSFALDDFGTGFCSFSYLRDLKVDYLKIDGSFVRDLDNSSLSEAVVRSIAEIAHQLGMRAVAEQVESDKQLQLLRKLHVDFGQGYLFQRPLPLADLFALARQPGTGG